MRAADEVAAHLYSARPRHRRTVVTLGGLSPERSSVVQVRVLDSKRHASGGSAVTLDGRVPAHPL